MHVAKTAVLPTVSAVVPPELSAMAFALLFALIQGLISAVLSLALGYAAQAWVLQAVMFWLITVLYPINAVYWFLFYRVYPQDVAAQNVRRAARVRLVFVTYVRGMLHDIPFTQAFAGGSNAIPDPKRCAQYV